MTEEINTSRKTVQEFVSRNLDITNDGLYTHFKCITTENKSKVRGSKNAYFRELKKQELLVNKTPKIKLKNVQYPDIKILIIEFRDFVGYVDKEGVIHEGTAFPPPIDVKERYLGILPHELEAFVNIWRYIKHGILFKWPRGFGKTYIFTWFMEFTLKNYAWPWLYLSSTGILSDVAFWVFKWAVKSKLLPTATAFQGSKKQTYRGFDMQNGGMFRIYDYMTEDMVGQHKWYIAMDDIVKRKWENKPSDNRNAKRQWTFSISHIKKRGLMICGTRKFQGDLLEFLENLLIPKGLRVEVKTPYIMEGAFPDWTPIVGVDGFEVLWVPELYSWEEIEEAKYYNEDDDIDPWLAFQSEMMQDPKPKRGGLCEESDLVLVKNRPFFKITKMVGIGVDISWSEGETADHTAIVSCAMYPFLQKKNDRDRGVMIPKFTFLKATIGRYPFQSKLDHKKQLVYGILHIITFHWQYLERYYPHVPKIVAIERNNGGVAVIEQARHDKLPWYPYIVEDHTPGYKHKRKANPNTPVKLGITHLKDKTARIFGELQNGIKRGFIEFLETLFGHAFIEELIVFPRGRYDDGADAGGMIKDELKRRFSRSNISEVHEGLIHEFKEGVKQDFRNRWIREMTQPWEKR